MNIFRQLTANNITISEYPFHRELAMEAYLIENEDILKLDNQNFSDVQVLDVEIALKQGRKDSNGRIDILAKYGGEYLAILELKLQAIDYSTLNQLTDYLKQKNQILDLDKNKANDKYWDDESGEPKWIGVLVGTAIDPQLAQDITNGKIVEGNIPIAAIVIKRFRAENSDVFVVTDTFFKFNYSSKDFSLFKFNGREYNKGRLVNAVLKRYIELNPLKTFQSLIEDFPNFLQGTHGVFTEASIAEDIYNRTGHKRYYIKPEELIQLSDSVIATCNQWSPKNLPNFINQAKNLNLEIQES